MGQRRYESTDFEWSVIEPLLTSKPRGAARVDDGRVLNGIYWRLRTGSNASSANLSTSMPSPTASKSTAKTTLLSSNSVQPNLDALYESVS
jgi:transposase